MPVAQDLGLAYKHYFTHNPAPVGQSGLDRLAFHILGLRRERQRSDLSYLDDRPPGSVLEIGFGNGAGMDRLRAAGWSVEGLEWDPVPARHAAARGYPVYLGDLREQALPPGRYDAIVSRHVIEHVPDVEGFLRTCLPLLRPGGRLVMITPNAAGYGHRVFQGDWVGLDAPRHLHLFNRENLGALAIDVGYGEVQTFTTNCRAPSLFFSSLDAARGIGASGSGSFGWRKKLRALPHVITAQRLLRLDPDAGEELVLIAERRAPRD